MGPSTEKPMAHSIEIRAGIPQPSGALVRAADAAGIPVLFSANAFARNNREGGFSRFNLAAARALPASLNAACDSAGFVAAVHYGDYRWSEADYLDLVQAGRFRWWAAMDWCCEPAVAHNTAVVAFRMEATARSFHRLEAMAADRGMPPPMPVLQGWHPDQYARSVDLLALAAWPDLVGIGSVCRRNVSGADGIEAIVETGQASPQKFPCPPIRGQRRGDRCAWGASEDRQHRLHGVGLPGAVSSDRQDASHTGRRDGEVAPGPHPGASGASTAVFGGPAGRLGRRLGRYHRPRDRGNLVCRQPAGPRLP